MLKCSTSDLFVFHWSKYFIRNTCRFMQLSNHVAASQRRADRGKELQLMFTSEGGGAWLLVPGEYIRFEYLRNCWFSQQLHRKSIQWAAVLRAETLCREIRVEQIDTQVITLYNHDEQKSIAEHTTLRWRNYNSKKSTSSVTHWTAFYQFLAYH